MSLFDGLQSRDDDPGVAAAIASRILVDTDERCLSALLDHAHLLAHAPELREMLAHLHRHTPVGYVHSRLTALLAAPPAPDPVAHQVGDPADGLDPAQGARLHREALRWALAALEPGASGDCLRAAASGDLRDALVVGVRATVEAARRDPVVDVRRARDVARLVQLFTARQIRAGLDPLPPGPFRSLLLNGPDALTVGMHAERPSAALALRLPRALPTELVPGVQPASAALLRRCPHCGAALRTHGPLEWVYRDDDRTVESEDGFAGTLDGTCAACGDGTQVRVRLSLAVSRGDRSGELTWHAVEGVHAPA